MATEVVMPKLGQTVERCTIVQWFAKEGEHVQKGAPLYEVETDKTNFEEESPASGILRHILYPAGSQDVPVLSVIAVIAAEGEDVPRPAVGQPPSAAPAAEATAPAAPVTSGATETPAPTAVESPALHRRPDGREKLFVTPRAQQTAAAHGLTETAQLAQIPGSGPEGRIAEKDVLAYVAAQPAAPAAAPVAAVASPLAQRMAVDAGLDLRTVTGTGAGGRITKEDVERAIAQKPSQPIVGQPPVAAPTPAAEPVITGLTGIRKIIAQRMRANLDTAAHVTLTTEADATEFVALRQALVADLEKEGVRPAYNDLLIKIVARVLREQPAVNASLTAAGIAQHDTVHVGLAVDTERGLLVPVVRDADRKGLVAIAQETKALAEKARQGKLLPDELAGGTFTITNLGMYEVDAFTPIINVPEAAILGVGRILPRAWVVDGQLAVRQIVALSLSFDHRIVDGAPAARFLQRIKQLIEKPHLMWG